MSKSFRTATILIIVLILLFRGLAIFFNVTPMGKAIWNSWFYQVQKADDKTNYETIKKVEDTARAMQSSYEADKLSYETYKDSDNNTKLDWAEQAKIRANRTATSYNEYILKSSFVWKDNIPSDIKMELPYIE